MNSDNTLASAQRYLDRIDLARMQEREESQPKPPLTRQKGQYMRLPEANRRFSEKERRHG